MAKPKVALVGVREIAELLGIDYDAAHNLSKQLRFPRHVAELSWGRVWDKAVVQAWNAGVADVEPEYVGARELQDLLGLSEPRVHQLARRSDFPRPVATLAAGRVWSWPAVKAWDETRQRRSGRPAKAVPA